MVRRCVGFLACIALLIAGWLAAPASAAQPGRSQCIAEMAQAGVFGKGVNPGKANIIVGTEGNDSFGISPSDPGPLTDGVDLVCGFGGNDIIDCCDGAPNGFGNGDVFLGGEDSDFVSFLLSGGTFYGGPGDDNVAFQHEGSTYEGGPGNDNHTFLEGGTFNGGEGDDNLAFLNSGTFNGGDGNDRVDFVNDGTFNGDAGDDHVVFLLGGTFNGGPGTDTVDFHDAGTFNQ